MLARIPESQGHGSERKFIVACRIVLPEVERQTSDHRSCDAASYNVQGLLDECIPCEETAHISIGANLIVLVGCKINAYQLMTRHDRQ